MVNPSLPFGIAPASADRRVNSAVEIASLKVSEKLEIPYMLNLLSSITIEEAVKISSKASKWLEIYPFKDRRITKLLVQHVEDAKFSGIIVSTKEAEISFFPSIEGVITGYQPAIINDLLDQGLLETKCSEELIQVRSQEFWKYINWLTKITKHPILLKGNFSEEQIMHALLAGISGITLTNPTTTEILEAKTVIDNRFPLLVSGDVICEKLSTEYLKLGADLVLIERPIQWGYTIDGQKGIEDVIKLFENANK